MQSFSSGLKQDLVTALDVPQECITLLCYHRGSVVAEVALAEAGATGFSRGIDSVDVLAEELMRQCRDEGSKLRSMPYGRYARHMTTHGPVPSSLCESIVKSQDVALDLSTKWSMIRSTRAVIAIRRQWRLVSAWRQLAGSVCAVKRRMARLVSMMRVRQLSAILHAWHDLSKNETWISYALSNVLERAKSKSLRSCCLAWKGRFLERENIRSHLQNLRYRRYFAACFLYFFRWGQTLISKSMVEFSVEKIFRRNLIILLRVSFRRWLLISTKQKGHQLLQAETSLAKSISLRHSFVLLACTYRKWHSGYSQHKWFNRCITAIGRKSIVAIISGVLIRWRKWASSRNLQSISVMFHINGIQRLVLTNEFYNWLHLLRFQDRRRNLVHFENRLRRQHLATVHHKWSKRTEIHLALAYRAAIVFSRHEYLYLNYAFVKIKKAAAAAMSLSQRIHRLFLRIRGASIHSFFFQWTRIYLELSRKRSVVTAFSSRCLFLLSTPPTHTY